MFTVGFVGALKPWHGLPVLAEAFALLHWRALDTRRSVVRDGPAIVMRGTPDEMMRRGVHCAALGGPRAGGETPAFRR